MKNSFKIFYSWQSDLESTNKIIPRAIEKAIKEIRNKKKKEFNLELSLDRDTRGKSGSPSIVDAIFEKIERSDIFICDVSIINNTWLKKFIRHKFRLTPNPNVMIELGYASKVLSWDRVICIADMNFSSLEDLPFDIRGNRITQMNSKESDCREKLTATLVTALLAVINDYDNIIKKQHENSLKSHDIEILNQINNIADEQQFRDSISVITVSLFTNKAYLSIFENWRDFFSLAKNRFIDSELNELFSIVLNHYKNFYYKTLEKFHFRNTQNATYQKYLSLIDGQKLTEDEQFEYEQSQVYDPHKEPFHMQNETWPEADQRIHHLQDEMIELGKLTLDAYEAFIAKSKQKLS